MTVELPQLSRPPRSQGNSGAAFDDLSVAKSGLWDRSEPAFAAGRWAERQANLTEQEPSFMTEEKARYYAQALAQSMGITFYVVRNREGRFLAVQIPSDGYEIVATVMPPA